MDSALIKIISSFSTSSSRHHHPARQYITRLRLSLSTQSPSSEAAMPFIAEYLVSTLGFTPDRALKISSYKELSPIRTPHRPDKLVSFLRELGLSDPEIRSLISFYPFLLKLSVEKTLDPQVCALVNFGFTGEKLLQLIRTNPQCLYLKNTFSRLEFWRNFVGGDEEILLQVIKRNSLMMNMDIGNHIMPRIDLLKEYGLSNQQIVKLLTRLGGFMRQSLDSIRWVLDKTEQLGISRESNMFFYGVLCIGRFNKKALEKKVALFTEMYGWLDEEISYAFKKLPSIFAYSEENIKSKMEFLVTKVGFEPRSIAFQATLLSFSIESKLRPRHNVLCILRAKGLIKKHSFLSVCTLSEKRFFERYVAPYEKSVPELHEAYIDSSH